MKVNHHHLVETSNLFAQLRIWAITIWIFIEISAFFFQTNFKKMGLILNRYHAYSSISQKWYPAMPELAKTIWYLLQLKISYLLLWTLNILHVSEWTILWKIRRASKTGIFAMTDIDNYPISTYLHVFNKIFWIKPKISLPLVPSTSSNLKLNMQRAYVKCSCKGEIIFKHLQMSTLQP